MKQGEGRTQYHVVAYMGMDDVDHFHFETEDEAREFVRNHNLTEYDYWLFRGEQLPYGNEG